MPVNTEWCCRVSILSDNYLLSLPLGLFVILTYAHWVACSYAWQSSSRKWHM